MTKVLLLIHDGLLAKAYRARLAREGFDANWQATGHEGLAKARMWSPDIIVLDATLPGMTGIDVLKFLRDVPWLVKVPVILLVEHTLSRDTLDKCLLWGAGSYLQKDRCTVEQLADHVRAIERASQPTPAAPTAA